MGKLVKNRVAEIRKIIQNIEVPVRFGYVDTHQNPADCATRGLSKEEAINHIWWTGTAFLKWPEDKWPERSEHFELPQDINGEIIREPPEEVDKQNALEELGCATVSTSPEIKMQELLDWKRHNQLNSALTSIAYVLRFLRRLSLGVRTELGTRIRSRIPELQNDFSASYITAPERKSALAAIIRNHQGVHVNAAFQKSTKDLNLQPDEQRILRCCGRLEKAAIPDFTKQPAFVAAKTPLAECIIRESHLPLHLSTSHTIARVRERFWIPKLRQQVQHIVRRCLPCQKLNNLPFRYPRMGPLPGRRVVRTKPFQNVGIDYFGPLTVKESDNENKVYGLIITCMTTRLLYLELVQEMSTEKLLMALRRFFARRGVPSTITSDNGPSFLLGKQILREAVLRSTNDVNFRPAMAQQGIEWTTITPYAPWQGAVYERLIKSVKHSLYKTVGNRILTMEELTTLMTEIEGCLNSRPLTYQGGTFEDVKPLRPIDFLVRDIDVTFPFENLKPENDDPPYLPPEELLRFRTRRQAEEALISSHKLTEHFWMLWQKHYLSSLREAHKLHMDHKRGGTQIPAVGTVVLIADSNLPRNVWKMGRISELRQSSDMAVREATVRMSNGHLVRRPVNLLVPLELGEHTNPADDNDAETHSVPESNRQERYNLRKRQKVNYEEDHAVFTSVRTLRCWNVPVTHITLVMACMIISSVSAYSSTNSETDTIMVKCVDGGVEVFSRNASQYEICAEGYCIKIEHPKSKETLTFPPEVTLHAHSVQWKTLENNHVSVIELKCPPVPFCDHVQCWLCTANILNPECHPQAALVALMTILLILYIVTALIYTLCYVPVVLGKPFRICEFVLLYGVMACVRLIRKMWPWRRRRPNRQDIENLLRAPLIAVIFTILLGSVSPRQDVDIFSLSTTVCSRNRRHEGKCFVETSNIIKLNTFNQEACIRLRKNESTIRRYRFLWKGLHLECNKETILFTRNTRHEVVDAERCAHSGSCTGKKCEDVKETSVIPELARGNAYPGTTRCMESCGGPGCGCFYLSSGCLFYRIFHVPNDNAIYELFRCPSWKEKVEIEIQSEDDSGKHQSTTVFLQPTVPVTTGTIRLSLSSLAMPPTPALNAHFITDGDEMAIWYQQIQMPLKCQSREEAETLNCSSSHNCVCQSAELRVSCRCVDHDITSLFHGRLENRMPVRQPWISFEKSVSDNTSVTAVIPTLVTSELIVRIKEDIYIAKKEVTDTTCTIPNTIIRGCYRCGQGAVAELECTSNAEETRAEVRCQDHFFSVPCSADGRKSEIRFALTTARVGLECFVSCGQRATRFEITGILNWVRTIEGSIVRILKGENTIREEIVFPDIPHILDTILSGYKVVAIALVTFVIALMFGYLFFWTCGIRILVGLLRLVLTITSLSVQIIVNTTARGLRLSASYLFRKPKARGQHEKQI